MSLMFHNLELFFYCITDMQNKQNIFLNYVYIVFLIQCTHQCECVGTNIFSCCRYMTENLPIRNKINQSINPEERMSWNLRIAID